MYHAECDTIDHVPLQALCAALSNILQAMHTGWRNGPTRSWRAETTHA